MEHRPNCAGVDEAGCGSLIGDLVACAVVIPDGVVMQGVADSKKLNAKKRTAISKLVREKCAVGIGTVGREEIDQHGFAWARRTVFVRALDALPADVTYSEILVDGTGFFDGYRGVPFKLQAKADAKFDCVAAASIVAKVYRDATIGVLCRGCEVADAYGWRSNMGYPTRQHLLALKEHGPTVYHRRTFAPCRGAEATRLP